MSRLTTTQALAINVLSVPGSLRISRPPSTTVTVPFSVRQNGHDLRLVDQLGAGHADVDVDDHRIQWLAKRRRN